MPGHTDSSDVVERLVNDRVACAVGQYVAALLGRQPIRAFASFISLDGMSVRRLLICHEERLANLPEET
jgi:hypothetical protein